MTRRGIPDEAGGPGEGLRSGRIPGRRGGTTLARHGSRLLILLLASALALNLAPVARGQDPTVLLFYDGLCVSINGVAFPTAPGASIVDISWNWGDGASTSGFFPQAHTYASIGTYAVVVTATDTNGATGSASVSVTPTNAPNSVAPILSISPATVSGFSVSINGFTGANTCGPQAVTLSWSWGDGTTTQSFFPASHTYSAPGSYNVCATTMDSRGLSTTQCETVIITAADATLATAVHVDGDHTTDVTGDLLASGTSVHDAALVGGEVAAVPLTGTLTFVLHTGSLECGGSAAAFGATVDVAGDGTYESTASTGALAAGDYSFGVTFTSTSSSYVSPPSVCEPFSIDITPAQAIENRIDAVNGMGLTNKVQKSLRAPLNKAIDLLNDDNPNNDAAAVCGKLDAFRLKVLGWQVLGELPSAQADQLLQSANAIRASLGCT